MQFVLDWGSAQQHISPGIQCSQSLPPSEKNCRLKMQAFATLGFLGILVLNYVCLILTSSKQLSPGVMAPDTALCDRSSRTVLRNCHSTNALFQDLGFEYDQRCICTRTTYRHHIRLKSDCMLCERTVSAQNVMLSSWCNTSNGYIIGCDHDV